MFSPEDDKSPPPNFSGKEYSSKGSRPSKNSRFSRPDRISLPARPPDFEKTIALAFLKATHP